MRYRNDTWHCRQLSCQYRRWWNVSNKARQEQNTASILHFRAEAQSKGRTKGIRITILEPLSQNHMFWCIMTCCSEDHMQPEIHYDHNEVWGNQSFLHVYTSVRPTHIMISTCPLVRPSVHPSVCLLPNIWTQRFDNEQINWHKWCSEYGHKMTNFGVKKSKVMITRPKKRLKNPFRICRELSDDL